MIRNEYLKGNQGSEEWLRFFKLISAEFAVAEGTPLPPDVPDHKCQSACKFDPASASNFDPFGRRVRVVAIAPSELVGVAETGRARVEV